MAVRALVRKKPVGAIVLDRAARSEAVLRARVCRLIYVAEGVGGLDVAVAQVSVGAAMKLVGPGLGNNVDHAAGRLSIFRGVPVGKNLELLHGILRDGRANTVGGVVDGVGAINVDQVTAGILSADVQS